MSFVGLLVALLPLAILAAGPFTDLNPGPDHAANTDIRAIADAGITRGCNPPDNSAYCPDDLVTREQMANFLARMAGRGGNSPVASARTAISAQSATTAQTSTTPPPRPMLLSLEDNPPATTRPPASRSPTRPMPPARATPPPWAGTPRAPSSRVVRSDGPSVPTFPQLTPAQYTTINTVYLHPPGPGLVLVTGSATAFTRPGTTPEMRLRDTAPVPATSQPVFASLPAGDSGTLALGYVIVVAAADPHAFILEGHLLLNAGALHVPFGSTGATHVAP